MNRPQTAVKDKPVPVFYIVAAVLAVMIISSAANTLFTTSIDQGAVQIE